MIFDGMQFRRTHAVVILPREFWQGDRKTNITFGRIAAKGTRGAVQTTCRFRNVACIPGETEPDGTDDRGSYWWVYAVPIPSDGHSLTNLMYSKDNKAYLAHQGEVYVRSFKKRKGA